MNKRKTKGYILCGFFVFALMFFITWQRVTIVSMGYKVSGLKENLREAEIKNQVLLKKIRKEASLHHIKNKAVVKYKMRTPDINKCKTIAVKKPGSGDGFSPAKSLASFIKKVFGPGQAQAK